jgi:hypothetical protein
MPDNLIEFDLRCTPVGDSTTLAGDVILKIYAREGEPDGIR